MMKDFAECKCRLCKKVFCCKNCRLLHEEKTHEIVVNCDICVYGRAILKDNSPEILEHFKSSHWPLHCVLCKKVFITLDDLNKHNLCPCQGVRNSTENSAKMSTPATPSIICKDNTEELSLLMTPFHRNGAPRSNKQLGVEYAMAVTSTPLCNDDIEDKSQVTPIEIKFIYKSSLKLSSGTLNESKKSDRKVTFCETPDVQPSKQLKSFTPSKEEPTSPSNDSSRFYSLCNVKSEEQENIKSGDSSLWQSAASSCDSIYAQKVECFQDDDNKILMSSAVCIMQSPRPLQEKLQDSASYTPNKSRWQSITTMIKSVMHNLSVSAHSSFTAGKRSQPDFNDSFAEEVPRYKKMKLTDLKCRRPIRHMSPLCQIRTRKANYVDKATQTDFF